MLGNEEGSETGLESLQILEMGKGKKGERGDQLVRSIFVYRMSLKKFTKSMSEVSSHSYPSEESLIF